MYAGIYIYMYNRNKLIVIKVPNCVLHLGRNYWGAEGLFLVSCDCGHRDPQAWVLSTGWVQGCARRGLTRARSKGSSKEPQQKAVDVHLYLCSQYTAKFASFTASSSLSPSTSQAFCSNSCSFQHTAHWFLVPSEKNSLKQVISDIPRAESRKSIQPTLE